MHVCEFKSDANPVMPILIPNLILNLRPASLHRHTTSLVTSLVTSLSLVTGLLG